jgi:uncharacterized membrane protein YdbT with pleckstrin-like domain
MLGTLPEPLQGRLRREETVHLQGRPDRSAFVLANSVAMTIGAGFAAAIVGVPALGLSCVVLARFGSTELAVGTFVTVLPVVLLALPVVGYLGARHAYSHRGYAVTDDRVIGTSGLLEHEARSIDLADVVDVDVDESLVDRIHGTGSIRIQTADGCGLDLALKYVDAPDATVEEIERWSAAPAA